MTDDLATISVIVADDDLGVREALADLLSDDPRFSLLGSGETGLDAAALAASINPDLAIVDIQMPQGGTEAIAAIHAVSPLTQVAVYSAKRGSRVRAAMIDAGAADFFSKGAALDLSSALAGLVTKS